MSRVRCAQCGITEFRHPSGALPAGWELYDAADPASPPWCAACVDWLLEQLDAELRRWASRRDNAAGAAAPQLVDELAQRLGCPIRLEPLEAGELLVRWPA